ncbi:MAG: EamA family transporter [Candidatus Bathyarchaeia archaeon]
METLPLSLVIISAVFHALWNLLAKKGSNKMAFIWLTNFTSLFSVLPVFLIILPRIVYPMDATPFLLVSGFVEAFYFFSLIKAYEAGDLSLVYPLARSSPLILVVLSAAFLKEELSSWGILGIGLTVLGVYILHLRGFSPRDFTQPLASLRSRTSQWAITAALWTSIYSLVDKMAVSKVDPILYAFWLDIFVVFFLTLINFQRVEFRMIQTEFKGSPLNPIISGFLMRLGYVLVLVAMSLSQVSYIIAIRQLSIVLGSFLGVAILREPYGRLRLIGSILIFVGVFIIGTLG